MVFLCMLCFQFNVACVICYAILFWHALFQSYTCTVWCIWWCICIATSGMFYCAASIRCCVQSRCWKSYLAMFSVRPTFEAVGMFIIVMGCNRGLAWLQSKAMNNFSVSLSSQAKYVLHELKCTDSIFLQVSWRIHVCACNMYGSLSSSTQTGHPWKPRCNSNNLVHSMVCGFYPPTWRRYLNTEANQTKSHHSCHLFVWTKGWPHFIRCVPVRLENPPHTYSLNEHSR